MSQNCELEQREEESYGNHEETYVPAQRLTVPTQIQIECRRVDSRPMLELVLGGLRALGRVRSLGLLFACWRHCGRFAA